MPESVYSDILAWVYEKKAEYELNQSNVFFANYRDLVNFNGSKYKFLNELTPVINVILESSGGCWFRYKKFSEGIIHIDIGVEKDHLKIAIEHEMLHFVQYLISLFRRKDGEIESIGGLPPQKNIYKGVSNNGIQRPWSFKNKNDNARSENYLYADVDINDVVLDDDSLQLFKKNKEDILREYTAILVNASDAQEAKKKFMKMFPKLTFYGATERTELKKELVEHPLRPFEYYPNANSFARVLRSDYIQYTLGGFTGKPQKMSKIDFFKNVLRSQDFRDQVLSMIT